MKNSGKNDYVSIYANLYSKLKNYGFQEQEIHTLINIYKDSNYNKNVLLIITNEELLSRGIDKIRVYVQKLKENLYRFSVTEVIIDKFVLENRNFYEQVSLINFLKSSNYDNNVRAMILDEEILKNNTFDQQYEMIKNYINECKAMKLNLSR